MYYSQQQQETDFFDDYNSTSSHEETRIVLADPAPTAYAGESYYPESSLATPPVTSSHTTTATALVPRPAPYSESNVWSYDDVDQNYHNSTHRNGTTETALGFSSNGDYPTVPVGPDIDKMKRRRKRRTVVVGVASGVVGLIALGPVGGIAGGVGGAMATKALSKRKERRKSRKHEQALQETGVSHKLATVPAESAVFS
jgi:hypothetical protein